MKHYFFDTSSFTKLFVVEAGSTHIRSIMRAAEADLPSVHVSMCDLAHPEAVAALRQIVERGEGGKRGISPAALKSTLPRIANAAGKGTVLSIVRASKVTAEAAGIASRRRVKGADAVHLAAARTVFEAIEAGDEFWFVSADLRQAAAARQEGMPVLDPTV